MVQGGRVCHLVAVGGRAEGVSEGQLLSLLPDFQHLWRLLPSGRTPCRQLEDSICRRHHDPCGVRPRRVEKVLRMPLRAAGRGENMSVKSIKRSRPTMRASTSYLTLAATSPIHPLNSDEELDEAIRVLDRLLSRKRPLDEQEK